MARATWTVLVLTGVFVPVASAHPDVVRDTPGYQGDTGLFHMPSASVLPRGKVAASLFRDNVDRDPKDVDVSIHGLSIAYGATPRLELFGSVGLQNRVDVDAAFQSGFVNDYPFAGERTGSPGWQTGFGDVTLGAKYQLFRREHAPGLALRGYLKVPTADENKGLGTGKASWGANLVFSQGLGPLIDLHGAVGYRFNGDPEGREISNTLEWGVGLHLMASQAVQLQMEVMGHAYDLSSDQNSPIDLVIGPVVWVTRTIFLRPALSWNLTFDDRGLGSAARSYTGRQISVGLHPGTVRVKPYMPPAPAPPPPANSAPTVVCEAERAAILTGETVRLRAVASDPDGDLLTYEWSSSAGQIGGSGAEVTLDAQSVAAGITATATVQVSDGRGGSGEATCAITIEMPRKAEAITCTSGGFPRNLARLNNVDKACLDDVAARLRQDPRSRLLVVGHADVRERYPQVVARRRAEAVKSYLARERGVEEARITVRSAAAVHPVDASTSAAAQARNRRVEVTFLPEGAAAPEDDR